MAAKSLFYKDAKFKISYVLKNAKSACMKNSHTGGLQGFLFLHGWGSNKELMAHAFQNCFKDSVLCFVDMPGFGTSSAPIALCTSDYAQILEEFLREINFHPRFIVGHSFGGKVASLMQRDVILLSSAGILERKSLSVRLKIASAKIFKKLGFKLKALASKDASGLDAVMYQTFKNVVDEDFSLVFLNFKKRAFIFWGRDDKATSLESGRKIANLIADSRLHILEGDHYFFLKSASEIERLFNEDLAS